MEIKIFILVIAFCFANCIQKRPFNRACKELLTFAVVGKKDLSSIDQASKDLVLTGCLLEHYNSEYHKTTPPFEIYQDGY